MNCYICDRPDGWGRTMLTTAGKPAPICIVCWRSRCQKCTADFDLVQRQPHEHKFRDMGGHTTEAEIWCGVCHNLSKKGKSK